MIEARVRVIYGDTDQMGVVYYANYLRYFELARSEFFRAIGGAYRDVEREGAFLPVVEAICRYKAPARYDDLLVIRTQLAELRRASLTFAYELRRESEEAVLCTGSTTHACVGRNGHPTRIPDNLSRLLKTAPRAEMTRGALAE